MASSKMLSAYVDELLAAKVDAIAKADDRSVSWIVTQAVREFIAKPENVVKWAPNAKRFLDDDKQVHLEDAIAQAVKVGPEKWAAGREKAKKGMAARAARMADRAVKRK